MTAAADADQHAQDRVRRWQAILAVLGEYLMFAPDSAEADDLTRTYHEVCTKLHWAEMAEKQLRPTLAGEGQK